MTATGMSWVYCIVSFGFMASVATFLFVLRNSPIMNPYSPSFGVESALVSVGNNTAEWDLELSVRNANKKHDFHYRVFSVYVQSMSQDWLMAADVGPFRQGSKNTTRVRANVRTLLPGGFRLAPPSAPGGGGMAWDLAVMLRVVFNGDELVQAFCRDLKVVFAQNATKGILVGGPIPCNLDAFCRY